MIELVIDQLILALQKEKELDQNQFNIHLDNLTNSISSFKPNNKKTSSRLIQNLLFIIHKYKRLIGNDKLFVLLEFIFTITKKYQIFLLDFVKCSLNSLQIVFQEEEVPPRLLENTFEILKIHFKSSPSTDPFILNVSIDGIGEEERSIIYSFYLIVTKQLGIKVNLQNQNGPINLLYEERFRDEFIALLSKHKLIVEGNTKILLRNGIKLIQNNCELKEISNYFINFIIVCNIEDDLFVDYLDYFLYYTSKSKQFEEGIGKIKTIIERKMNYICCISLLSLILEFFSLTEIEINYSSQNIQLFPPSCEKTLRKAKKFINSIDQSLKFIFKKNRMNKIPSSIGSLLVQISNSELGTLYLQQICCCYWMDKESLLKNDKIPIELKEFCLLRYSNELSIDNFTTPNCKIIYEFKKDGSFSEQESLCLNEYSLPSLKIVLLIALLKGKFKFCLSLLNNSSISSSELSFIYYLCLFEMGYEEKSNSTSTNSLIKFVSQFVLDYFGLPGNVTYTGSDRLYQFFATLNSLFKALIEDENLAQTIQLGKNALKLIDFLLAQQQTDENCLLLDQLLLLSYLTLSTLYLIGNLYLIRGSTKESKWCYQEGLERSKKLHSDYFIELFSVKMEIFLYHYNKSKSITNSYSHLKSSFDSLLLSYYNGIVSVDFHLSKQISQYYKEKYNLFLDDNNNENIVRLYGDDKVLAMIKQNTNPIETFAYSLSIGSIKHIELALINLLKSSVDISTVASCLELAKGNTIRREIESEADVESIKRWIVEFKETFVRQLPPNKTVISIHQLENDLLLFNVWTNSLPTVMQFRKKLESKFTVLAMTQRWKEIGEKNKQSLQLPADLTDQIELKNWWFGRKEIDSEIGQFMQDLEDNWIGHLKGIFLIPFWKEKVPIESCNPLSNEQNNSIHLINNCISKLLGSSIDEHDSLLLSQLIFGIISCSGRITGNELSECLEAFQIDVNWSSKILQEIEFLSLTQLTETAFIGKTNSIILIPFREIFDIPIENINCLRRKLQISRVDSFYTLRQMLKRKRQSSEDTKLIGGILNPSNDLSHTQTTFESLFKNNSNFHESSIVGRVPSEQDFLSLLQSVDNFLYFGHGGGEGYLKPSTIRKTNINCNIFLIGCSSGKSCNPLDSFFDPIINPINYLWSGSSIVISTLWDITDKDVDRIMLASLEEFLSSTTTTTTSQSLSNCLWKNNANCLLRNATGSSLVFYGIF